MRRKLDNKDLLDDLTDKSTLEQVNSFLTDILKDLNSEKT